MVHQTIRLPPGTELRAEKNKTGKPNNQLVWIVPLKAEY